MSSDLRMFYPTMIATEHCTCSGLTVRECSIFVRNTLLHIHSMSIDGRKFFKVIIWNVR